MTLGNIIGSLVGHREKAIADGRGHALHPAATSLAKTLSYYCNPIYWFNEMTHAEYMPNTEWLSYIVKFATFHRNLF